jgi:hypothetical protein
MNWLTVIEYLCHRNMNCLFLRSTCVHPHFVRVARSLVFCAMFCRSLFVIILLVILLSVLWFTVSDYPFCIIKLFFMIVGTLKSWFQIPFIALLCHNFVKTASNICVVMAFSCCDEWANNCCLKSQNEHFLRLSLFTGYYLLSDV